jgi:hypothetical protein
MEEFYQLYEPEEPWMTNPPLGDDIGFLTDMLDDVIYTRVNNAISTGPRFAKGLSTGSGSTNWSVKISDTEENLKSPYTVEWAHPTDPTKVAFLYVPRLDTKGMDSANNLWGYAEVHRFAAGSPFGGNPIQTYFEKHLVKMRYPDTRWESVALLDEYWGNDPTSGQDERWVAATDRALPVTTNDSAFNFALRTGELEDEGSGRESWQTIYEADMETGVNVLKKRWTFPSTPAALAALGHVDYMDTFLVDYESKWCGYATWTWTTLGTPLAEVNFFLAPIEDIIDSEGNVIVPGGMENAVHKFTYDMITDIPELSLPDPTNGGMKVSRFWHMGGDSFAFIVFNEQDQATVAQFPMVWGKWQWHDEHSEVQPDPGPERVFKTGLGWFPRGIIGSEILGPLWVGGLTYRPNISVADYVTVNVAEQTFQRWEDATVEELVPQDPPRNFIDLPTPWAPESNR